MKRKNIVQYLSENTHRFLTEDEDEVEVYDDPNQEDLFGKSGTDDKPRSGKEYTKKETSPWASGKWKEEDLVKEIKASASFESAIEDELYDLIENNDTSDYDLEIAGWRSAHYVSEINDAIENITGALSEFYVSGYDQTRIHNQLSESLQQLIAEEIGDINSLTEHLAEELAAHMFSDDADVTEFVEALSDTSFNFDDFGIDLDGYSQLRKSRGWR